MTWENPAKQALLMGALALAGCNNTDDSQNAIEWGVLASVTGSLAYSGPDQTDSAQLAVEQINQAGGVLGKQLKLLVKDDGSDKTIAANAAAELVAAHVPVVFGSYASGMTLAAAPALSQGQIVEISGSASSPQITDFADDGYLFRTNVSDAFQGNLMAKRAYDRGHRKVAVIYVPGPYGEGLAQAFQQRFVALGGEVSFIQAYTENSSSYTALLTSAFATSPQALYLVAYPVDGAQVITDYNTSFSDRSAYWYFGESLASTEFVTGVGSSGFSFGHEGAFPAIPSGPRYDAFYSAFQSRFGRVPDPNNFAAQVYDAVYLAALAMQAGGAAEGTAIRDHLQEVSAGGSEYDAASFKDALAAVDAHQDVDYQGASGKVDLDAKGDVTQALYNIWHIQAGSVVTVESNVSP